jgi:hypothetical protein
VSSGSNVSAALLDQSTDLTGFTDEQMGRLAADPVYQARRALLAEAWEQVRAEVCTEERGRSGTAR